MLDEKETIRNDGVLSEREIGGDIWIHAYDAPGNEVRKGKRIFTSDLGIDETAADV